MSTSERFEHRGQLERLGDAIRARIQPLPVTHDFVLSTIATQSSRARTQRLRRVRA
jgi:hypothetical protein